MAMNGYADEAGFLNGFSSNFLSALMDTTHYFVNQTDATYLCKDKLFLISGTEAGVSVETICGSQLSVFTNDNSRIAYPTDKCISKNEYKQPDAFSSNTTWFWYLADTYGSYPSSLVYIVNKQGKGSNINASNAYGGVRPLCNLPNMIPVSEPTDYSGIYSIKWN